MPITFKQFYANITESALEDIYTKPFLDFIKKYRKHKNDFDLYVNFTNYPQNLKSPPTSSDHSDPQGTYAYPIKYVIDYPADVKYGRGQLYMRVLRKTCSRRETLTFPTDIQDKSDAENLQYKLNRIYKDHSSTRDLSLSEKSNRNKDVVASQKWSKIFFDSVQVDSSKTTDDTVPVIRSAMEQNARFRALGYKALEDTGKSHRAQTINDREPNQICFLQRDAFEIVEVIQLRPEPNKKKVSVQAQSQGKNPPRKPSITFGSLEHDSAEARHLAQRIFETVGAKVSFYWNTYRAWVSTKGHILQLDWQRASRYMDNRRLGEYKHKELKKSDVNELVTKVYDENLSSTQQRFGTDDTFDDIVQWFHAHPESLIGTSVKSKVEQDALEKKRKDAEIQAHFDKENAEDLEMYSDYASGKSELADLQKMVKYPHPVDFEMNILENVISANSNFRKNFEKIKSLQDIKAFYRDVQKLYSFRRTAFKRKATHGRLSLDSLKNIAQEGRPLSSAIEAWVESAEGSATMKRLEDMARFVFEFVQKEPTDEHGSHPDVWWNSLGGIKWRMERYLEYKSKNNE